MEKREIKIAGRPFSVELAKNFGEKSRGLAGRKTLGENEGMLFVFKRPAFPIFWMKGMAFPIDILWLKKGKVVGFEKNCPPAKNIWQTKLYWPRELVDSVLEIESGAVAKFGFEIGEEVSLS
ncbi:MAG TPA: DUF192 domain-containing protein [Candidatus Tyrphobacter sp.]|nr:DUF192 domain-containing protein [Candidatus Tyrphobacter sp.]